MNPSPKPLCHFAVLSIVMFSVSCRKQTEKIPPLPELTYSSTAVVSTLAGSTAGFANGTGTATKFSNPNGIVIDKTGNIYAVDYSNNCIRKITPAGQVGNLAGSSPGFSEGNGSMAKFDHPQSIAVDGNGNFYVTDVNNQYIRKITVSGDVSTIRDSSGMPVKFPGLGGIAVDNNENIFVASDSRVIKITPAGIVTTLAGSTRGFSDGTGSNARFTEITGIVIAPDGNLFVADWFNSRVRKISPLGEVTTFAGSTYGHVDGTRQSAKFEAVYGIAIDANSNLYVTDNLLLGIVSPTNHCIRKITPAGVVTTIAGSLYGYSDGVGAAAKFNSPMGIAADANGNLYVADSDNNRIRKITL
ncbi:MAG: NHL repeat-containing protein [Bacteroidota bacterium]